METNFFQLIKDLNIKGRLQIGIAIAADETITVSVLPVRDDLNDTNKNMIPPLSMSGTAEELGREWYNRIAAPVRVTDQLFDDMQSYVAAQEKVKKELEAKKQADKSKTTTQPATSKFDAAMKKVDDLAAQKKYGEAVSALPKPDEFPDEAGTIEEKKNELMALREQSQNSLFA